MLIINSDRDIIINLERHEIIIDNFDKRTIKSYGYGSYVRLGEYINNDTAKYILIDILERYKKGTKIYYMPDESYDIT